MYFKNVFQKCISQIEDDHSDSSARNHFEKDIDIEENNNRLVNCKRSPFHK
jgi:hypothetical protein